MVVVFLCLSWLSAWPAASLGHLYKRMKTLASSTLVVCIALFTLAHDSHAHTHSLHKHNPKHNADTPVSDTASESTPNFPTSSLLTSMTPSSMAASLRRLFESEPASGHEGGELISVRYRTPALSAFDLDGGHPSSTKIEFQAFDKVCYSLALW